MVITFNTYKDVAVCTGHVKNALNTTGGCKNVWKWAANNSILNRNIITVACFLVPTVLTQDENGDSIEHSPYVGEEPHEHSQLGTEQPNIVQSKQPLQNKLYTFFWAGFKSEKETSHASFLSSHFITFHNTKSPALCSEWGIKLFILF